MSSTRASPTTRSPCWQESSAPCTSSRRGGGDHLGAALSAVTPPTSSLTAPRGRSSTHPESTITPSGTTTARAMTKRSTTSGTSTFPVMTPLAQRRMTKVKRKPGNFTGLCLMSKSLQHISDFDFDVSDDLSLEGLSLRVVELENALCNQDKLLSKVFREKKKLNLELESASSEIASL
jgi:hypothetical protein